MHRSNTPPPVPNVGKGYQPLREGHQPAQALNSAPPQGGSGVPGPSAPAAATNPVPPATPSGSQPGKT